VVTETGAVGVLGTGISVRPPKLCGFDQYRLVAVVGAASAGLGHLAVRKGRELWRGLAVLRSRRGGGRVIGLVRADRLWSASRWGALRRARTRAARMR
jgi:hypothetical protein